MYNAITVGNCFFDMCKKGTLASIHSIFEKVVNVVVHDSLTAPVYTIARSDVSVTPAMLVSAMPPDKAWHSEGLEIGRQLFLAPNHIFYGCRQLVGNISGAYVWNVMDKNSLLLLPELSHSEIGLRCMLVSRIISNSGKRGSVFTFLLNLDKVFNQTFIHVPNISGKISHTVAFQNLFYEGVKSLQNAMRAASKHKIVHDSKSFDFSVKKLIGLGEGLTPTGDDFLAGVLFALHFIQKKYNIKCALLPYLVESINSNLINKTNQISIHFLRNAAEGQWGLATEEFLTSMFQYEKTLLLQRAIEKKLSYGETSGMDEIFGILFGLYEATKQGM